MVETRKSSDKLKILTIEAFHSQRKLTTFLKWHKKQVFNS
ncbi:unnamed protein product [Chironomus riparius]|uniref:Uncharacterized protein n=1 Tax=Chironomus riparius TaxID=315576 RepID=A0A9N9WSR5_9DIPT|nr:unnamed protein product [Chironomus riparius]